MGAIATFKADPSLPNPAFAAEVQLEARLMWGRDVLSIEHVDVNDTIRLRDLGLPGANEPDLVVARFDVIDGAAVLVLPNGTDAPSGHRMTVRSGKVTVRLALVRRERAKIDRGKSDGRVVRGVAIAAMMHAAAVAVMFQGRAGTGDEELAQREAMEKYLAASESRAVTVLPTFPLPPEPVNEEAAKHEGTEGLAGNPARTNDSARKRETNGIAYHKAKSGEETEEASTFGMLALVAAEKHGARPGSSPWEREIGPAAMGNIFGATIDDAQGTGGLGLSGPGEGGGGKSGQVKLDGISMSGTCDAQCRGKLTRRSHQARAFYIQFDDGGTQVNGRLPPEAIQRVVRANHGRLRGCYAEGLQRDPGLEGRVAVKFVIDRSGAVALVSTQENGLSDASVARCVTKQFANMSFPQPEGGIVTVVYPLVFTTGA